MLRNALLVMVTIAAILPTLSLTACQPSETAINAQNLKLPEQEIKIVGQLQYDNNTQALLIELSSLPAELHANEALIKQLQIVSADGKVSDDKLQKFKDLDQDGLLNADEIKYVTNLLNPDTDADGLSDGQEVFTYKTDPLKPNPIVSYGAKANPDFSIKHIEVLRKIETDGDVGDYGHKFVDAMVKYYPKVDENVPTLYNEMMKLPDFSRIEERDISASDEIFNLASNPKYREAFESMLNEGLKDKRKYCTPLEALLWIAYDRELYQFNPLDNYSLDELLVVAWQNTNESDNYKSDRWRDLDIVRGRLNSIPIVTKYVLGNFSYDTTLHYKKLEIGKEKGVYFGWLDSAEIFNSKKGGCGDQTGFVIDCLCNNGHAYAEFDVNKNNAVAGLFARGTPNDAGHTVCLFIRDGKYYTLDSSGRWFGNTRGDIRGPFSTIHDAAVATSPPCDEYGLYNRGGIYVSHDYLHCE